MQCRGGRTLITCAAGVQAGTEGVESAAGVEVEAWVV